MVDLIVVDAGHTLGTFDKPGTHATLGELSRLSKTVIEEECRRFLHCAPALTEEVITGICNALLIDPQAWPRPWPARGFTAYPYTLRVLGELREIAPVVVLSNVAVTCGQGRMDELVKQCAPHIDRTYTSFAMGMRKPDRRLWHAISVEHGVRPERMVHLGDQWVNDVLGAVSAGCRAVLTNTRGSSTPSPEQWPVGRDRIAVAADLRGTVDILRAWHEQDGAA